MLSASQLAQLIVSTRDLPAAADFYHRRLGLPLLAGDGAEVRVDAGGAEIRLCRDRFTSAASGPPCVLVFLVNGLVATQAALAARDLRASRSGGTTSERWPRCVIRTATGSCCASRRRPRWTGRSVR